LVTWSQQVTGSVFFLLSLIASCVLRVVGIAALQQLVQGMRKAVQEGDEPLLRRDREEGGI